MRIHPIELDLPLSQDQLIDIMLIQWRTPMEDEEGLSAAIQERAVASKARVLESLATWTLTEHGTATRPLFVLTPEISTPLGGLETFKDLIESLRRPAVIVAGLEYLDRDEYRRLISSSNNPEPEFWMEGVDAAEKINAAAILTRDVGGNLNFFVQPKIHPADIERRWRVYGASHVLVFHHRSHAPGAGVNFCVQICSDFCTARHVSLLRKQILEAFRNENLGVDLTLLLECNADQQMPQFRDGTNAFFQPQAGEVSTDKGTLVMLNNASRASGKSAVWGDSQFRFPYNRWRQGGGEFTYCLAQNSGEYWQDATFREPGPCAYWVTFKPLLLCDTRPASGDSLPFKEASCWKFDNPENLVPTFKHVSAVMHWLESEWSNGKGQLATSLAEQGSNAEITDELVRIYSESATEWIVALNNDLAKRALQTLFACFRKEGYPYGTTHYREMEPRQWGANSDAAKAAIEMIRLHALLKIGALDYGTTLAVDPLGARHVTLANSISTTYLWGGADTMAEKMAEDYRDELSWVEQASTQYFVIVLINPRNRPDTDELQRNMSESRVNRASTPAGAGPHLNSGGEVTTGEGWKPIFVYHDVFENAVMESDITNFRSRLSETVGGVVNRATSA
jgi:hypothetical protein